jgi:glycosyltransferase involved in cell wall biosynthesis
MERVFRVLYLITELDIGGAEQVLLSFLKNMDRYKYEPAVCCFSAGALAPEIQSLGIRLIDLKAENKFDLLALFRLWRILNEERFDIVHTHLFHANIAGRVLARLARVAVVVSTHHYAFSYNGAWGAWLDRLTCRLADRIIAVSRAARNFFLLHVDGKQERVELIYNGVDLDAFGSSLKADKSLRESLCLNNDFIVGCIGRFAEVKGQSYLLEAARALIEKGIPLKVLLVGSGPWEGRLKKICQELNIVSQVIFLGSRRDVPAVLESIDLYVQPSLQEGLSIILLEALAMRRPVIATAVGGNSEVIVNGESGLLIPARDRQALAAAVADLLSDKEKANRLAQGARLRIEENFDIRDTVRKTEALYSRLIKEKKLRQ